MKLVADILLEVSRQLNDNKLGREYQRWTRADLLVYLNDALTEVGAYRPDAFSDTLELPLVEGSMQVTEGQMLAVNSFNGVPVTEGDLDLIKAWGNQGNINACMRVDSAGVPIYKVSSYALSSTDSHIFYVDPPVPTGVSATINATVSKPSPRYTLLDLGEDLDILPKYINNIKDYMLFRAYNIDSESVESGTRATQYYSWFYNAMGAKYKMESAQRSGYYLGKTGSGDPRSRA